MTIMSEIIVGTAFFTLFVLALAVVVIASRAVLLPSSNVLIVVNDQRKLTARTGQSLLSALRDSGIAIPSTCAGVGSCGLCSVLVTSGGGIPLPTETARLTKREIRGGMRLACQVTIRDTIEVEIPDNLLNVDEFVCTVVETHFLSPLIREIVLALPPEQGFEFRPGAYVQITAPAYRMDFRDLDIPAKYRVDWERLGYENHTSRSDKPVTRAYSIANTPADVGRIVLLVRLALPSPGRSDAPVGIVSSYLFGLAPGDTVAVSGPYGNFGATQSEREMVFIGGGVGMAPLRSIIFDQLERRKTNRRISFWYGARSSIDLFYEQEFERLAVEYDNFTWTAALSDPAPGDTWDGPTGFIHTVAYENYLKSHPAPEQCEYYLCGPPLMIQAVLGMLEECGVDEETIFFDDFGGAQHAAN